MVNDNPVHVLDLGTGLLLLQQPMNVQLAALFEDWDAVKLTGYLVDHNAVRLPLAA